MGGVRRVEKIYKICDISINTSIKEGVALTSYESLSMGVPVVSSNVGGQAELITDDVGVIVPCLQKEKEILNFNYSKEEIENYVKAIEKVISKLQYYKSNSRKRILKYFTLNQMIEKLEDEFEEIAENPNIQKIENGKNLESGKDILKELISTHFISVKGEYEYLVQEFNNRNVHKRKIKLKGPQNPLYEHTIEYKVKHPIVVVLRKIGIYDDCKKIFSVIQG